MQEYQQEQEKREEVKQQIALVATKLLHDPEQHCRELQPLIQLVGSRDEVVSTSEIVLALAVLQFYLAIAAYIQLEYSRRHPATCRASTQCGAVWYLQTTSTLTRPCCAGGETGDAVVGSGIQGHFARLQDPGAHREGARDARLKGRQEAARPRECPAASIPGKLPMMSSAATLRCTVGMPIVRFRICATAAAFICLSCPSPCCIVMLMEVTKLEEITAQLKPKHTYRRCLSFVSVLLHAS